MPQRRQPISSINSIFSFLSQFPTYSLFVFCDSAFGLVSLEVFFKISNWICNKIKKHSLPFPWAFDSRICLRYKIKPYLAKMLIYEINIKLRTIIPIKSQDGSITNVHARLNIHYSKEEYKKCFHVFLISYSFAIILLNFIFQLPSFRSIMLFYCKCIACAISASVHIINPSLLQYKHMQIMKRQYFLL